MTDIHTTKSPTGETHTTVTSGRSGNGFILFVLGGVVAVVAVLWLALGGSDSVPTTIADPASAPAAQAPVIEGDTNVTVQTSPAAPAETATPTDADPAVPAPAAPAASN